MISETAKDAAVRMIGSLFGFADLEGDSSTPPRFFRRNRALLANGRSGVWLAARLVKANRVWVPSYLCHTILDGVLAARMEARFYEVDDNLRMTSMAWAQAVSRGDMVVFIDFFGWPTDPFCKSALHERGAWILEDACQALLSETADEGADFILVSPRKFLGVPDGAILCCQSDEIDLQSIHLEAPPQDWWLESFIAMLLRREHDLCGNNRAWFEHYQRFDAGHPIGAYAMSSLSQALLLHRFNYEGIARQRIENYRVLAERLGRFAVFPHLSDGVVPLGFPARFPERDRLREALFKADIYPPVHWKLDGVVPRQFEQSHRLSAQIMTLPCDQRYNFNDMERMAEIVLKELRL